MTSAVLDTIGEDRTVALVRLDEIPDAVALTSALAAGGIRAIEFTFTTPNVEQHIQAVRAAIDAGEQSGSGERPGRRSAVGAGTVLTAAKAKAAIDAGAQFLVTPGLSPIVAEVAVAAGIPILMGALTPSEVMQALELGAAAVKIFPAQTVGPTYFRHLHGPFPDVRLIGSGGLNEENSRSYLEAGAFAVTAGSSVITRADVSAQNWAGVTERARKFAAALSR
jgi:2-dehydro-3-deoxyphosphogluconate aldolase/(4S)-4-hydroxy-2-oxoglutarate aldolase